MHGRLPRAAACACGRGGALVIAVLLASLPTMGCLGGWRVGSGLTVDTTGQVGAQSYVGGYFGLGDDEAGGIS